MKVAIGHVAHEHEFCGLIPVSIKEVSFREIFQFIKNFQVVKLTETVRKWKPSVEIKKRNISTLK